MTTKLIPQEVIQNKIFLIRGKKVMFDKDLAKLYGVTTGALIQAVKRNAQRFPDDFMYQLTKQEFTALISHFVISKGRGGTRQLPYAFTEHGVLMLSSVLNSEKAVMVNIEIMRAFTRLREMIQSHKKIWEKIEAMERGYDSKFKVVFDALRRLLTPGAPIAPPKPKGPIGFHV